MKKTTFLNCDVSQAIEKQLNIKFENYEFSLDGWGDVDNYAIINENSYVFLECELGQSILTQMCLNYIPILKKIKKLA